MIAAFVTIITLLLKGSLSTPITGIQLVTRDVPYFVVIKINDLPSCGGTIVAPNVVLTAAKCLFDVNRNRFVNKNDIDVIKENIRQRNWFETTDSIAYFCRRFLIHDSFNPNLLLSWFDAALIEIEGIFDVSDPRIEIIRPCPTPHHNHIHYHMGFLFGFGSITGGSPTSISDILRVTLQSYPLSDCNRLLQDIGASLDPESHLCYGKISESGVIVFNCFIIYSTFFTVLQVVVMPNILNFASKKPTWLCHTMIILLRSVI